ncbi:MAG: hypothetical protein JWQ98_555 [Chlorobi bacterium]|nr:hypothetical protein [Chlorobiota bacterium]
MWGDRSGSGQRRKPARFIPTHVGRSPESCAHQHPCSVHPHACGEIGWIRTDGVPVGGSSPRMWGDHLGVEPRVRRLRFIPTHVGRSSCSRIYSARRAVHPHACGEIDKPDVAGLARHGSSPRMWGDRIVMSFRLWRRRFIPTHVGRSYARPGADSQLAVHPHACGEIFVAIVVSFGQPGSSPRMWGDLQ